MSVELEFTSVPAPINVAWQSVTYGNGLFVAVAIGTNKIMTSPDGINWTARDAIQGYWYSVTYGSGLFVAVAYTGSNIIMTSPDGINWTVQAKPSSFVEGRSVCYANGSFVIVGNGNTKVITSPDGITWTVRQAPGKNWMSVTYGDGLFAAVAYYSNPNRIMT